jgi:hypothetical protein
MAKNKADWMTASAPFFRALVVYRYQVYSVKGAEAVIQSASTLDDFVDARFLLASLCTPP